MIYVIGDSNTLYLCQDRERTMGVISGTSPTHDTVSMSVGNDDVMLMYYSGKSAYSVSYDFLTQAFTNIDVNSKDHVIFQFGAIDIRVYLKKYNNIKDIIESYVTSCLKFCSQHNISPIFVQPFTCPEFVQWNMEFEEELRIQCKNFNIPEPVELFGSFIERVFDSEPEDEVCHLTYPKNKELLDLLVSYTSKTK